MNSVMRLLAVVCVCCFLAGCSGLLIQDDDSIPIVAGKMVVRTLIVIPTLGISETTLVDLRDAERNRAWRMQLLPRTEQACLKLWQDYADDHQRRRLFESVPHLVTTMLAPDYVGETINILSFVGVPIGDDPVQRDWRHTIANEPQGALLSQCAQRFHLRRFFTDPE